MRRDIAGENHREKKQKEKRTPSGESIEEKFRSKREKGEKSWRIRTEVDPTA